MAYIEFMAIVAINLTYIPCFFPNGSGKITAELFMCAVVAAKGRGYVYALKCLPHSIRIMTIK